MTDYQHASCTVHHKHICTQYYMCAKSSRSALNRVVAAREKKQRNKQRIRILRRLSQKKKVHGTVAWREIDLKGAWCGSRREGTRRTEEATRTCQKKKASSVFSLLAGVPLY